MGVMLSLDRPGQPGRGRRPLGRKHGQHARTSFDQAWLGALAALLRGSTPVAVAVPAPVAVAAGCPVTPCEHDCCPLARPA